MARRLGVSRDDVVAAAVRVCDRDGVGGLTVAAVAGEVGCRPPSVYHHVDGLDGLRDAVAEAAAAHLALHLAATTGGVQGVPALALLATATRDWAGAHPARWDALTATADQASCPTPVVEAAREALTAERLPEEQRPALLAAFVAAIRGAIALADDPLVGDESIRRVGGDLVVTLLVQDIQRHAERPAVAP